MPPFPGASAVIPVNNAGTGTEECWMVAVDIFYGTIVDPEGRLHLNSFITPKKMKFLHFITN
jgi:hypothetical protein